LKKNVKLNNITFYMIEHYDDLRDVRNIIKSDDDTLDFKEISQNTLNKSILDYENKINYHNKNFKESQEFLNLSLNEIFDNFTKTLILILNDLVLFIDNYLIKQKNTNDNMLNDFLGIFIKSDRLLYVGLFLILISMFIYFMDVSL
tara:strand:- start:459 stop:896 length:438 start_codon:yes stop_codon:yes gene_type:complete